MDGKARQSIGRVFLMANPCPAYGTGHAITMHAAPPRPFLVRFPMSTARSDRWLLDRVLEGVFPAMVKMGPYRPSPLPTCKTPCPGCVIAAHSMARYGRIHNFYHRQQAHK